MILLARRKEEFFNWEGNNEYFSPPIDLLKDKIKEFGSYKGAANWFGVDRHTLSKLARKNNIKSPFILKKYTLDKDEKEYIKSMYYKKTAKNLSEEIGCSESSIAKVWREAGLIGKQPYTYYYNTDYFEKIDTPPKAYYLGFILGDGCVHSNINDNRQWTVNISIHPKDRDILEKFKNQLNTKKPIYESLNGSHPNVTLQISSDKMYKDLFKYGVKERKSTEPSSIKNIPEKYERDFLRGFFDADGSIYRNNFKYFVTNLAGNYEVIKYFSSLLIKYNITPHIYQDTHKDYTINHYGLRLFSIKDNYKFMKVIYYKETKFKLERKYKRFLKFKEEYIE